MGGRTHWTECWRDPAHHGCAVGEVEKWKTEYARIAGDYAEETSYLRKRAERAEDIAKSVRTGAPLYDMLEQRNAAITRAEQAEAEVERLRRDWNWEMDQRCAAQHDVLRLQTYLSEACERAEKWETEYARIAGDYAEEVFALTARAEEAEAEVERLRADAARWLRSVEGLNDAAIDAARGE